VNLRRQTPWLAAGIVLVLLVAGLGVFGWRAHQSSDQNSDVRRAAQAFVTAWTGRHLDQVTWSGTTGAAMQTEYSALVAGMGRLRPSVRLGAVDRQGSTGTAKVSVSWDLASSGTWSYANTVTLQQQSDRWQISPEGPAGSSLFAPVPRDTRLVATRTQGERGQITGRGGAPIVEPGTVVDVGIEPARIQDAATLVQAVARITDVDPGPLARAVAAASPHEFVPVITLRESDYRNVRDQLQPLKGTVFRERSQALALTKDFARALIGTVGPVTAEIVSQSGNRYQAGDFAGVSGLQRQYDAQLAGAPAYIVRAVPKDTTADQTGTTLFQTTAKPGQTLATTLDVETQLAADSALAKLKVPGALVAIDVRSGGVLAVANTPSNGLNRAMVGRYPPGSTLKVATTLALLRHGVTPSTPVNCPGTAIVGGRSFRNYEHEQLGSVPFSTDFKNSCNTAFVGLSPKLQPGDLHAAALQLGLGGDWAAGLGAGPQTFTGSIPTTTSAVDQAAAAFGQGRNLVSPLAMAVMAASVARGSFQPPKLVTSPAPTSPTATSPSSAATASGRPTAQEISTLHSLMRLVVTSGTAAGQFSGVPGAQIFAKTGTAEFGSASPPATHAWLIGWQGNVAFAAFVEEGKSGGSVAGPVVRRFLTALHRH
jgi:cell division protein FtsI/penicillin-binding protein 2